MSIRLFSIVTCVVLLLCVCGITSAQDIVPQVTLTYDSASWTYTYHVVVPANASHVFGELSIYGQAWSWNGVEDLWTSSGPFVGAQDQGWIPELNDGDLGTTARWRARSGQEVLNGPNAWEGDFVIVAPNTYPVAGTGMTKNGVWESISNFNIDVPGAVPEPSTLVAFGSLVAAAGMFARRRR